MMSMTEITWTQLKSAQEVAEAACHQILQQAELAIRRSNTFRIVLAGGSTPQKTYELLSKADSDWSKWEIYFGDERCLTEGHTDLNSTMAMQSLLDIVPINPKQVFTIPIGLGAEKAAAKYISYIQQAMPFDMVLLGMGEDGHTASIFPGHCWLAKPLVYAVHNAPKPPDDRITLSIDAFANTRKLMYLVTGKNKADAVSKWIQKESLPVNSIKAQGECEVLIDKEACQGLVTNNV